MDDAIFRAEVAFDIVLEPQRRATDGVEVFIRRLDDRGPPHGGQHKPEPAEGGGRVAGNSKWRDTVPLQFAAPAADVDRQLGKGPEVDSHSYVAFATGP